MQATPEWQQRNKPSRHGDALDPYTVEENAR